METIRTSEDVVVARVGRELYEKFFRGYTRKQWGLDPSQLDKSVTARVPTRTDRDDRYFTDTYQFMPADGYTAMFERMLDHPNIEVRVATEHGQVRGLAPRTIWTGPVDEYFGNRFGKLPYRSLRFRHETHACGQFQPVGTVNYPQDEDYTRITEYKHLTGQVCAATSLTYEYPSSEGDPYYPILRPETEAHVQALRGAGRRGAGHLVRGPPGDLPLPQHGPGGRPGAGDVPPHPGCRCGGCVA